MPAAPVRRPPPVVDVMVCRGCCCGTDKHPGVDHDGHRAAIEAAVAPRQDTRLKIVDCLNACSNSNVAVVRRRRPGKAPLGVWLGGLLDDDAVDVLAGWVAEGGPRPAILDAHVFAGPTRWTALHDLPVPTAAPGARPVASAP